MAIPNLGAYTKSWRDLLDLQKLQGAKARLPLAPRFVFGPILGRKNNEMFGVLPFRKSGTSSKKKKMKKKKRQKKKKQGEKLYEKRRNGRRTRGGTDCEREPGTLEGIFFLFG